MSDPKDIVLNSIRILRSRRVRPSDAKIAWLARREFLQRDDVTADCLRELVQYGDVLKVIYKGATSYRVAPHKVAASNKLLKPVAKKLKLAPTPTDILRPLLSAIAACDETATKERIAEQLVVSGHRLLVDRLDTVLQKELRVGLIGKRVVLTPGERSVAQYYITKSAPLALISTEVRNDPSGPFSVPLHHQLALSDNEAPAEDDPEFDAKSSTPFQHLHNHLKKLRQEKEREPSGVGEETDDPPDDPAVLLEEEEIVEEAHRDGSISAGGGHDQDREEGGAPDYPTSEAPSPGNEVVPATADPDPAKQDDAVYVSRRGRPRKAPAIYEDLTYVLPKKERGTRSQRITDQRPVKVKKARKVFDPSSGGSGVNSTRGNRMGPSMLSNEPVLPCEVCGQPSTSPEPYDQLLVCHNCSAKAHPNCLGYSTELALKCRLGPWTCMDCKHCTVCNMDHNNGTLIFCDECDKAYHLTCHSPPIQGQPTGSWICNSCTPGGYNMYESLYGYPTPSSSPAPDDENAGESWDIPDAVDWDVEKVIEYFTRKGFGSFAHVFEEQDIDGTALLMLTRTDVLTALNLKLGPALKIYKHVRILQTRRPNPPLP